MAVVFTSIHTRQLLKRGYLDPKVWAEVRTGLIARTDGFSGADIAGLIRAVTSYGVTR